MLRRAPLSVALAACSAALTAPVAIAACAFALPATPGADLVEFQLTPDGVFQPADGRDIKVAGWRMDAAIASRVIERHGSRRVMPVIDYEHQTLHREANGQPAPAAGWIREIVYRPGEGLYGLIELTARAREQIAAGEYRYFSPVFSFDKQTGAVLAIEMGALTNTPALDSLAPLELRAAATFALTTSETSMNKVLAALVAALALPELTTEDAALAALTARLDEHQQLRQALGLQADADGAAAVAACTALRTRAATAPDPARFVAIETVEALRQDLAVLTARQRDRDVEDLVRPALEDGRLLPAMEGWARDLGKTDVAALSAYLKTAQPIPALAGGQTRKQPAPAADGELTAEEVAVCSMTGVSPEAYKASKLAHAAQRAV